jgi:hypothetical protein
MGKPSTMTETDPIVKFMVNKGRAGSDNVQLVFGFNANDLLVSSGNLKEGSRSAYDYDGDGIFDSTLVHFNVNNPGKDGPVDVILVGYSTMPPPEPGPI